MTTGARIRMLRLKLNMTQEELAKKVGVQKSAIYKYEKGLVVNFKQDMIQKLSDALEVRPSYLMGMNEESPTIYAPKSETERLLSILRDEERALLDVTKNMTADQVRAMTEFAKALKGEK